MTTYEIGIVVGSDTLALVRLAGHKPLSFCKGIAKTLAESPRIGKGVSLVIIPGGKDEPIHRLWINGKYAGRFDSWNHTPIGEAFQAALDAVLQAKESGL